MAPIYRVEAHDGYYWRFGIRRSHNNGMPEFCGLHAAEHFTTRAEAMRLRDETARLCGGSLRVASCKDQNFDFTRSYFIDGKYTQDEVLACFCLADTV